MYTLRLYHDHFHANVESIPDLEAQHSIIYIYDGSATVNGQPVKKNSAIYCPDVTTIKAGPKGAQVWRWDLVRTSEPNNLARGEGIKSPSSHIPQDQDVRACAYLQMAVPAGLHR